MPRTRTLTLFQPLREVTPDVIATFEGDPGRLLPDARAHGPGHWRLQLHGAGLSREVDLHLGDVWSWGNARWRSITWEPLSMPSDVVPVDKLLPSFVGELGLQIESRCLVLTGTYDPPMRSLGAIADATVLGSVARATGRKFLGDIALRLGDRAAV